MTKSLNKLLLISIVLIPIQSTSFAADPIKLEGKQIQSAKPTTSVKETKTIISTPKEQTKEIRSNWIETDTEYQIDFLEKSIDILSKKKDEIQKQLKKTQNTKDAQKIKQLSERMKMLNKQIQMKKSKLEIEKKRKIQKQAIIK